MRRLHQLAWLFLCFLLPTYSVAQSGVEGLTAQVYERIRPQWDKTVEVQLNEDMRALAQILDRLAEPDVTRNEHDILIDLLRAKREELLVNERVLRDKLDRARASGRIAAKRAPELERRITEGTRQLSASLSFWRR